MQQKYRTKRGRIFKPGELVKIHIPNIDRQKMDRRSLPCKIIQKKPSRDWYYVACLYGIIERWYSASDLEPLETSDYPLLDVVPLNKMISLRQAGLKQRLSRSSKQSEEFGESSLHYER